MFFILKMTNDNHKYFLQFMFKNSCVSLEEALRFCNNFNINEVSDENSLKKFVNTINTDISQQEMKISFLRCEITNMLKITLLNTANDEISKLQNVFSAAELEYFQVLLKELVIVDSHKLPNIFCYNLNSNLRKDNVEKLLKDLIHLGYLVEENSSICLGSRCISEFGPYFKSNCKDYYTLCHLCFEPVFVGKTCSKCNKIMHKFCIDKILLKQNKCPSCKKIWQESDPNTNSYEGSVDQEYSLYEDNISQPGPSHRKFPRLI